MAAKIGDLKSAASRKALDRQLHSTKLQAYRDKRISEHKYKGKYYGPDEFKGSLTTLKSWRAAGSPKNTKDFVGQSINIKDPRVGGWKSGTRPPVDPNYVGVPKKPTPAKPKYFDPKEWVDAEKARGAQPRTGGTVYSPSIVRKTPGPMFKTKDLIPKTRHLDNS
jgi:hypothetical protein